MCAAGVSVIRSRDRWGGLAVRVGVPLADVYLEFLGGRCRPNTVLAAAYDLKVFFSVVGKPPGQVRPGDVLAFITAQRTGGAAGHGVLQTVDPEDAGVSAATVRRRLSIVSGFFAFLQARGDVEANPVPRGPPTRRERSRPRQGVPLVRATRKLPRILAPVSCLSTRCPPHGPDLSGQFRVRRGTRQHGHRRAAITVLTWAGTIS
jgi:integrase/recombinase XerD